MAKILKITGMKWERKNYQNNTIFIYNKGKIMKKSCLCI